MDFGLLTSTKEEEIFTRTEVFPNPGNGHFFLRSQLASPQEVELRVINLFGQQIYAKALGRQERIEEMIELEAVPAGQYLLQLRTESGAIFTQKLLKQ